MCEDGVRNAISIEIKRLAADQARLEAVLKSFETDEPPAAVAKPTKPKKRLRLKEDKAADITNKVVKATKAHRDGASRKDIVTYLSRNGYIVGHHFNEPHLSKIITKLLTGDAPAIRQEGDKGTARYFAV